MQDFQALWHDAQWVLRINDWTRRVLAEQHLRLEGTLQEVQVRPWSIVLKAPTDAGLIFFKATPPGFSHESALTEWLAQRFPQSIPQVLAVERTEGWWLARDGGTPIRAELAATRDLGEWHAALVEYAALQKGASAHIDDMLALKIPDRRPSALPALITAVLRDRAAMCIGLSQGLTETEYAQLQELVSGPLREWAAELEGYRMPLSIHHGDLNSGNVLTRNGEFYFVDWGDASVGHSFFSLRTVLVSVEIVLDLPENDPSLAPLRETYLQAWQEFESAENLRRAFALAMRLSALAGVLSWYNSLQAMSEEEREKHAYTVPALLQEFLHADMSRFPFA